MKEYKIHEHHEEAARRDHMVDQPLDGAKFVHGLLRIDGAQQVQHGRAHDQAVTVLDRHRSGKVRRVVNR